MSYQERRVGPLKNPYERQLYEELTSQGWEVTKRGWPDFACYKGNDLVLIEVKPKRSHHLKKEQYRLMAALASLGVECFRWTPNGGFQSVTPMVHDISRRQHRKLQLKGGAQLAGERRSNARQ